jgi:hypothetical protein
MIKKLRSLRLFTYLCLAALGVTFSTEACWSKTAVSEQSKINNYTQIFLPLYDSYNQLKIAIRSYDQASLQYFLLVDPYSLKTQVTPVAATKPASLPNKANSEYVPIPSILTHTPYIVALQKYNLPPYKQENYGATAALFKTDSVFLTVDMCPSTKKFAKSFFEELIKLYEKNLTPTPVAISVSGLWMLGHIEEFAWLKEQFFLGKLDITWVNHSFYHPYVPNAPNEHNFLLIHEERFEQEVLETEKILLENNLTPSVFFRYPGLVANENLIKKLNKLSLIPLGSNAWLAKGECIAPGAFILIHGNGNEPEGINMMMPLLSDFPLLSIQKAFMPSQIE